MVKFFTFVVQWSVRRKSYDVLYSDSVTKIYINIHVQVHCMLKRDATSNDTNNIKQLHINIALIKCSNSSSKRNGTPYLKYEILCFTN